MSDAEVVRNELESNFELGAVILAIIKSDIFSSFAALPTCNKTVLLVLKIFNHLHRNSSR
jgi:hypothetical protein